MAKKTIIPIILLAIVMTPAYALFVGESDGSNTSINNAVRIDDPQVLQVYYETLRFDQKHFYTFDAAQGETINFQLIIPFLDGLENYMPTIAFYKEGGDKEFIRFSQPMFFGEIQGERTIRNNFYENQDQTRIIGETGTYIIEIFDEGNCLVRIDSMTEKKCDILAENPFEFFDVIQGKYALKIGTVNQNTIHDDIQTWVQTRIFLEDPIGNLISSFGVLETGDSEENINRDDFRWIIIISLIIITAVIIWKRNWLRRVF